MQGDNNNYRDSKDSNKMRNHAPNANNHIELDNKHSASHSKDASDAKSSINTKNNTNWSIGIGQDGKLGIASKVGTPDRNNLQYHRSLNKNGINNSSNLATRNLAVNPASWSTLKNPKNIINNTNGTNVANNTNQSRQAVQNNFKNNPNKAQKDSNNDEKIDILILDDIIKSQADTIKKPKSKNMSNKSIEDIAIKDIDIELELDDEYKARRGSINVLYVSATLFVFIIIFLLFLCVVYFKASSKTTTKTIITKSDIAVRGSIFSIDNYLISSSDKVYTASISPEFIAPNKKDVFVNLVSIYTGLSKKNIQNILNSNSSYVQLADNLDSNTAANLEQLNAKLLKLNVFRDLLDENSKLLQKRGIDIEVSKVNRNYLSNHFLEPALGYIKESGEKIKRIDGIKGIERYRDDILSSKRDGKVTGLRDIGNNVILSKNAQVIQKEDGFDIKLNTPLILQMQVEKALKAARQKYKAGEIVAGIMDPHDGSIIALASSNTYNPNIGQRGNSDVLKLMNVSVVEKSYEPGSTIKPLVFSYLLDKNLINLNSIVNVENGIYKLRSYTIKDSTPFAKLSTKNILVKSSNIGMVKLTKNLSGVEMQNMFKTFKLGQTTGIDIAYEKSGLIPKSNILNREVEKAAASYGYGLEVTFMQLLRAYGAFVNGGKLVTPHIANSFISPDGTIYVPKLESAVQVISQNSANYMKKLLHEVVIDGTGANANVKGLIIGGKTGTAHIASKGEYKNLYNGSFFGYASDGTKTYVIGVVAFESHSDEDYYGGRTAAPIFANIAELLVDNNLLKLH